MSLPLNPQMQVFPCLLLCLILLLGAFQSQESGTSPISQSQLKRDTTEARRWIAVAQMFRDSARHDSSIVYMERARSLYRPHLAENRDTTLWKNYLACGSTIAEQKIRLRKYEMSLHLFDSILVLGMAHLGKTHPLVVECHHHIGRIQWRLGAYQAAIESHQKALDIQLNTLGENHLAIAKSYEYIGRVKATQAATVEALEYYQKALKINIQILGPQHKQVGNSYTRIGAMYEMQGAYDLTLENYQKALHIEIATLGENHPNVAGSYNVLGRAYYLLGDYNSALKYHQKALSIFVGHFDPNHFRTISTHQNIANVYDAVGSFELALDHHQKAISIQLKTLGARHSQIERMYNDIGTVYLNIGSPEAALENFRKALVIKIDKFGQNHPSVATTYSNMGIAFTDQRKYEAALEIFQKALEIRLSHFGEKHPQVALDYNNIGVVFLKQHLFAKALSFYQKALQSQFHTFDGKHPQIANTYNNIGQVHSIRGSYDLAFKNYQKALTSNSLNFQHEETKNNPGPNDAFLSENTLIRTLSYKADALYHLSDLQHSYDTYQLAISRIDQMRQGYRRQADKGELLKNASSIYEGAIKTSLKLYQQTQGDSFLQQAFTIFEKSRSMLLLEALQETNAEAFGGLPDQLLEKENEIESRLAFYEKRLFEEQLKQDKTDRAKADLWQDQVFKLRQSKDCISSLLEAQYSEYYRLKYDLSVVSIDNAQALLPDDETAILEYFIGDSCIYVFVINRQDYQLIEIKKDFLLEEETTSFITLLSKKAALSPANYQIRVDSLTTHAHRLYQKLLAPIAAQYELPLKLIILPDGPLSYLPFGVLLKAKPEQELSLNDSDFLIKHHQISYCFSATLLLEMQARQHPKTKGGLLAVAPSFSSKTSIADSLLARFDFEERQKLITRTKLEALENNIPEVEEIGQLMGNLQRQKILTGSRATLKRFLIHSSNYNILHISSHAAANDKVGNYSWIAFHPKDPVDNGFLYNRDLYNLNLVADLVVLSACETGLGQLQRGEGIIGLTRGFSYAGAKSLVTSLWAVNDRSTRDLMQHFYQALKEGQSKDAALRAAKLQLLHNNDFADPFYWAAFTPIGDMSAIDIRSQSFRWVWLGLGAFVLLTGWFFFFRPFLSNYSNNNLPVL